MFDNTLCFKTEYKSPGPRRDTYKIEVFCDGGSAFAGEVDSYDEMIKLEVQPVAAKWYKVEAEMYKEEIG